jgi:hypothetical protein
MCNKFTIFAFVIIKEIDMTAFEIKWDLEDDVFEYNIDDCDLPTEVDIPDYVTADCTNDQEICDEVVNYLSNEYGFFVIEFGLR